MKLWRLLAIVLAAGMVATPPVAAQLSEAKADCSELVAKRTRQAQTWDFIVIDATASYPLNGTFAEYDKVRPAKGETVQLCDRNGLFLVVSGPEATTLKLNRAEDTETTGQDGGVLVGSASPPPTGSRPANPPYPIWPPEAPSSRASLDRFIAKRNGLSLYDAGQRLIASFEDAGYLEHSFYSAPAGFVLVTRIEKIAENGSAFEGAERYRLPHQRSDPSMTEYIRGLFLEAPPGFYRYIAVVVSNQPYQTSSRALSDAQAARRLRDGSNDLDRSYYASLDFSADYKVEALIYEFRKDAKSATARMIDPGRLPPQTHLARTRLDAAIRKQFAR